MNLFNKIKAAGRAASNALFSRVVETSLPNGVIDFMNRFGKVPDVSQDALVRKYFGWTYACANVSATRLASVPLRLYASRGTGQSKVKNFRTKKVSREQDKWLRSRMGKGIEHMASAEEFEELEEHPLLDLLQNVNEQENSFEIKELTSVMLDLTGNAYWMIERDKLGIPTRFFVLRSQYVRIIPDKEKFIKAFWYGYNNAWGVDTRLEIEPENVIHFKYPNPLDPWYGMGPVQAAAYAIESQEMREKFVLATMGNMARPDLIVKYLEGELDPNERQNVEREWNALFRGAKNAGKVKVTDFRYEIDKIGWTPQELDFNKGEDWILKKICSVFPVPLGLIDSSQISRAPRSGMEGSDLFMAQFNTLPRCTRIEEKLNEQLCPMYDGRLFLAFDNPVPKDRVMQNSEDASRLSTYQTSINEIRKRDGLDPVPWGDVPLVSGGVAPLGSTTPDPTQQGQDLFPPDKPGSTGGSAGGASSSEGSVDITTPPEQGAPASQVVAQTMRNLNGAQVAAAVQILTQVSSGEISADAAVPMLSDFFGIDERRATLMVQAQVNRKKEFRLKSANADVDMEMDGGNVHPTLAGVPVKLRMRNEGGKFDKKDPDKLRTDRETAELLRLKGDAPGHEFRGNQFSSGGGGGAKEDRNSDERSDARYFAREQRRADAAVETIKTKIKEKELEIAKTKVQLGEVKVREATAALAEIRVKKEIIATELKASGDRMEKLRKEWEDKFPGKPLPKFAQRKGEESGLEKRILDEMRKREQLICDLEDLVEKI